MPCLCSLYSDTNACHKGKIPEALRNLMSVTEWRLSSRLLIPISRHQCAAFGAVSVWSFRVVLRSLFHPSVLGDGVPYMNFECFRDVFCICLPPFTRDYESFIGEVWWLLEYDVLPIAIAPGDNPLWETVGLWDAPLKGQTLRWSRLERACSFARETTESRALIPRTVHHWHGALCCWATYIITGKVLRLITHKN